MPGGGITAKEQSVRIAGVVVRLSEKAFEALVRSEPVDLVISSPRFLIRTSVAGPGAMRRGWQYLAVSRGVVFHTMTTSNASLPSTIKLVEAEDIWVSFLGPKEAV